MSERKYVVAVDTAAGRVYISKMKLKATWTAELSCAHRFDGVKYAAASALHVGPHAFVVSLRPKGAPRRDVALIAQLDEALEDVAEFASWADWFEGERDEARAELAVIRSERDQMQGRWEAARTEVERLTEEFGVARESFANEVTWWREQCDAGTTRAVGHAVAEMGSMRLEKDLDAANARIVTIEAEVFSLENRLRRQDVPTDGAMFSGKPKAVNTPDEAYQRIDELEKQVSAVKGQNRDKGARIAKLEKERDESVLRIEALNSRACDIQDGHDEAVANARRAAVEECLNLCLAEEKEFRDVIATEPQHKSFALHCTFGVAAVERAIRALLTTPTADDGKGEP